MLGRCDKCIKNFSLNPEGKKTLKVRELKVEIDLKEKVSADVAGVYLVTGFCDESMGSIKLENFVRNGTTINFLIKTVLHGVIHYRI
jgi:small ligand-binding sensory domain FIST